MNEENDSGVFITDKGSTTPFGLLLLIAGLFAGVSAFCRLMSSRFFAVRIPPGGNGLS
jgi:hypothetical protein